jgi:F-type H+-transporting ATPase subunit a
MTELYTFITSPLDQFEIRNFLSLDAPLFGNIHLSLTNIGFYLTIATLLVIFSNLLATNYNKVLSNN